VSREDDTHTHTVKEHTLALHNHARYAIAHENDAPEPGPIVYLLTETVRSLCGCGGRVRTEVVGSYASPQLVCARSCSFARFC
jgi:hypothetical protein